MPHVDPDSLTLLALGEPAQSAEESAHLATCAACARELESFSLAARVGRESLTSTPLDVPHERVWQGIAADLGIPERPPHPVVAPERRRPPAAGTRRRRLTISLLAGAAAVAAVGGVWFALAPSSPTVLATARLDALPAWPTAGGSAQVERLADGSRVIRVTLDAPEEQSGFREAWLITGDASALVSLGVMTDSTATFAVPDGIDTANYELVDVSEEAYDGDPTHSGDSIVRGPLREG